MTRGAGRSVRRRLGSAALLLAGILALLAMGPQFMVFIPILLLAWLLARFGLVPRAVHPRDVDVRILGGPAAGDLRFADVRIHADPSQSGATAELVLSLVRALSRQAGAEPLELAAGASEPAPFHALTAEPPTVLDATGLTLLWLPGTAPDRPATLADDREARWRAAWPAAVAAQSAHRAAIALEARWESGADAGAAIGLLGDPALLGAALTELARECRRAPHASAWTSGWVREIERETAREEAARRRRAKARERAS